MRHKSLLIAAVAASAVLIASGCGGDDDSADGEPAPAAAADTAPTNTQTTSQSPSASGALSIRMTEYAFNPKDAVAKAGQVTITAPNNGQIVHELVLLKTAADPANLPKKGTKVDESTSVGEIADVAPGETKAGTFKLAPGKYAIVCALPGHYEAGMYGSLTVK